MNRLFPAVIALVLIVILPACSSSPAQLHTIETQVAGSIFATLTAVLPSATAHPLKTATAILSPFPTLTATPFAAGVVRPATLNLREGPGLQYTVLGGLKSEEKVYVLGEFLNCSWIKIRSLTGDVGWVKGDYGYIKYDTPCASLPHGTFRPLSGVFVVDRRSSYGLGSIIVENGTQDDAIVVITGADKKPLASFYVRKAEKFTLKSLSDGSYMLYFTTGAEWDGELQRFLEVKTLKMLDKPLSFSTTATTFSTWNVTLQPMPGGTSSASDVTLTNFPSLK